MINFEKFIIGVVIGSFVELCVVRSLRHESIIFPRSHCDYCSHQLRPWELIPIISFLLLRGRCSKCKHKISQESPITEFLAGLIFLTNPVTPHGLLEITFQIGLLILSLFDLKTMLMPTKIILILSIISLIQIIPTQLNWQRILSTLIFYLLFTITNHYFHFIGNGDIDIIFILIFKTGIEFTTPVLLLASVLALLRLCFQPNPIKIPFIPYLSMAYFCLI